MAWADNNYAHKKKITIDHTKVSSNQTDFPIALVGTDADLTGCLANGYDIKFYDSTEINQLKHERVEWDNTTGYFVIYVKIPSLSSLVDTDIYIYYEYPGEVVDQADPTNVWDSNFLAVYHCNDANTQLSDSTSNGFDAGENNNPKYRETGKIGKCCYADNAWRAVNGNCWYHYSTAWLNTWNALTDSSIEWWNACDRDGEGTNALLISIRHDSSNDIRMSYKPNNPGDTGYTFVYDAGAFIGSVDDSVHTWAIDEWHHGAAVQNSTTNDMNAYTDGSWVGQDNVNYPYNTSSLPRLCIASRYLVNISNAFDGKMEEIRISGTDRSSGWIGTSYNNQNNPSAFSSFGPEENPSGDTFQFKFPLKSNTQHYKYDTKDTQHDKYRNRIDKNNYKYKIKEE